MTEDELAAIEARIREIVREQCEELTKRVAELEREREQEADIRRERGYRGWW